MLRQLILAATAYLVVGVALVVWSLSGFAAGAPREDWALMIVLPLAWIFGFWPSWGALVMAFKLRAIGTALERIGARMTAGGTPEADDLRELEQTATALAAQESGLPEFIVRPAVRRGLARVLDRQRAAAEPETAAPRRP